MRSLGAGQSLCYWNTRRAHTSEGEFSYPTLKYKGGAQHLTITTYCAAISTKYYYFTWCTFKDRLSKLTSVTFLTSPKLFVQNKSETVRMKFGYAIAHRLCEGHIYRVRNISWFNGLLISSGNSAQVLCRRNFRHSSLVTALELALLLSMQL